MAGSPFLFELIHSLDKQEKRYVQLFIKKNSIGSSSNYLLLLQAISSQKTFDEKALKERFKGHPIQKSFAVTKYYLYELVLKALAAYHTDSDTDMRLTGLVHKAQLLYDKKLFEQCGALARRGQKEAEALERPVVMLQLMELEMHALHSLTEIKQIKERSDNYFEKQKALLRQQEEVFHMRKLSYDIFVALKTDWVRNKGNEASWKELLKVDPAKLSSLAARVMYYQNMGAYLYSVNDRKNAHANMQKLSKLFEAHPRLIDEHRGQYIALLNNLILMMFKKKDYAEILSHSAKLRALKPHSAEEMVKIKERVINIEWNVYKNTGEFEKGEPLLEEMRGLMKEKHMGEVYRLLFHLDLFTYYFVMEEYRPALKSLNDLLGTRGKNIRSDIQKTARILSMLVHYELGNFDLFESLLRSSKRFFSRKERPDAMGKLFLSFFQKVVSIENNREKAAAFQGLRKELQVLFEDKLLYETYFKNFEFLLWAEANSIGKSMAELFRQRAARG